MHEELYELYEMVMRKQKFSPSEMEAIAENGQITEPLIPFMKGKLYVDPISF